jgi:hypothetical protein
MGGLPVCFLPAFFIQPTVTRRSLALGKRQNLSSLNGANMANFFKLWLDVALDTSEMMTASAQVISHRTTRMAQAGLVPDARDQKEFHLMKQEKVEAATESIYAMALPLVSMNQEIGMLALNQTMKAATNMIALATSVTPLQSSQRQAKLINDTIAGTVTAGQKLSDSVAKVAGKGLKPIGSRAKANAKRLGRT